MKTYKPNQRDLLSSVGFILCILGFDIGPCNAGSYNDSKTIVETMYSTSRYNPEVRPILDQSEVLNVSVSFQLVSIVGVDDVSQSLSANGFFFFLWTDQLASWNPSDYGGETEINPPIKNVWRPRVVLLNTREDRDLFEDFHAPLTVGYTGFTTWIPGSLFETTCELDMTNYPFDVQTCNIEMLCMKEPSDRLKFLNITESVGLNFYTASGEWQLDESNVITHDVIVNPESMPESARAVSGIEIRFKLKRHPTFLLLNIILPVVFLSLLNIFVFMIPVESGEKISYGITVLLALSVFLSVISSMLPRSSNSMPSVIIYLFVLLIISTLTVLVSIAIVYLHSLEEKEDTHNRAQENFQHAFNNMANVRQAVSSLQLKRSATGSSSPNRVENGNGHVPSKPSYDNNHTSSCIPRAKIAWRKPKVNRYKIIGKHIDKVSFILFFVVWLSVTLGFMCSIST